MERMTQVTTEQIQQINDKVKELDAFVLELGFERSSTLDISTPVKNEASTVQLRFLPTWIAFGDD